MQTLPYSDGKCVRGADDLPGKSFLILGLGDGNPRDQRVFSGYGFTVMSTDSICEWLDFWKGRGKGWATPLESMVPLRQSPFMTLPRVNAPAATRDERSAMGSRATQTDVDDLAGALIRIGKTLPTPLDTII
jgi:hypothetical protein